MRRVRILIAAAALGAALGAVVPAAPAAAVCIEDPVTGSCIHVCPSKFNCPY